MPLTHSMATRLGKTLTDVRKSGECWWLRPDGKTQVTIEYLQHPDGSVEPKKIHTVVISTQHAEPLKAVRSKECAGYKGAEMTAPSMEQMNKEIEEKVIKRTLESITLKSGKSAITLYGSHTHLHINPSGKFIIGGPQGDAGLTGRKIIIDTYGGWGAHGGGAFSGKDPTKAGTCQNWASKNQPDKGTMQRLEKADPGGPICGIHLSPDGQVRGQQRPQRSVPCAAVIRHWRGETFVSLCGDLRQ